MKTSLAWTLAALLAFVAVATACSSSDPGIVLQLPDGGAGSGSGGAGTTGQDAGSTDAGK